MKVKEVYSFKWGTEFSKCPRCGSTMECEYHAFATAVGKGQTGVTLINVKCMGWDKVEDD